MENNEEVCFKIEKKSNQKSFLKIESHVLETLKGGKGIPDFYLFGFSESFNILIIELLDKTIEDVFEKHIRKFSLRTTCIIAIQLVRK
jgi:casein kinase 1